MTEEKYSFGDLAGGIIATTIGITFAMESLGKFIKQLDKEEISRLKKLRRKGKCLVEFRNISKGNYYDEGVYRNEEIKITEIKEYLKTQKKKLGSYWAYREEDLKGVLKYHLEFNPPIPLEVKEFTKWKKEKKIGYDDKDNEKKERWWYNQIKILSKLNKKKVEKFYFYGGCPHCGYESNYIGEYFKLKKELGYKSWRKIK